MDTPVVELKIKFLEEMEKKFLLQNISVYNFAHETLTKYPDYFWWGITSYVCCGEKYNKIWTIFSECISHDEDMHSSKDKYYLWWYILFHLRYDISNIETVLEYIYCIACGCQLIYLLEK